MSSSPKANSCWFTELDDMEDPMLLQEFMGDCLIDYPSEGIAGLMDDQELNYSFSTGSECNSSNAAGEISDNSPKHKNPDDYAFNPSNHIAESNQHSQIYQHSGLSPEQADTSALALTVKVPKRPRRLPQQCQNHIITERQRRQTISQRFIALAALIPGLKKLDKTSVLGEAITHMKELKEKLKILEEENAQRRIESAVVLQTSSILIENDSNSSTCSETHQDSLHRDDQFPEIEARFCNRNILIKIHCRIQVGLLSKIIDKIENFNLTVTNTTIMPFQDGTIHITIMAQMEMAIKMSPQEIVANLRSIC